MFLSTSEFRDKLQKQLNSAKQEIIVLSAFLKENALRWLFENTPVRNISVVTRWHPNDLVAGISDHSCYEFCRENGIRFGIASSLHAKVYCIDGHVLVGSANATNRGLALASQHNDEFGVCVIAGYAVHEKLSDYLRSVTWVDDELFSQIKAELARMPKSNQSLTPVWSDRIRSKLRKENQYIWMHELPFNEPYELLKCYNESTDSIEHDLELLGLTREYFTFERATTAFSSSRAYEWCHNVIRVNESLWFGGFTHTLHNAVLDDPTPYRREVKQLTQVLFSWLKLFPSSFEVSRPRHSEVITFVQNDDDLDSRLLASSPEG